MFRTTFLGALAALLVVVGALAGETIVGSKHDFSNASWNPGAELCRVCHIPHDHGRQTGEIGLLWNHALPEHAYVMYSSGTIDGPTEPSPVGVSKMCLSCHDGTVAVDRFDGQMGTLFIQDIAPNARVPNLPGAPGSDLRATHPISIRWVHDEGNSPKDCNKCHDMHGGPGLQRREIPFFEGRVECATCHDVHDSLTENLPYLLRKSMERSQLCYHCHEK